MPKSLLRTVERNASKKPLRYETNRPILRGNLSFRANYYSLVCVIAKMV